MSSFSLNRPWTRTASGVLLREVSCCLPVILSDLLRTSFIFLMISNRLVYFFKLMADHRVETATWWYIFDNRKSGSNHMLHKLFAQGQSTFSMHYTPYPWLFHDEIFPTFAVSTWFTLGSCDLGDRWGRILPWMSDQRIINYFLIWAYVIERPVALTLLVIRFMVRFSTTVD